MILANQKGQLTTEFIFAIVIAFGLFTLFFAMTYTFSVIEISQYVVYASARTHAASNLDKETQRQEGMKKFQSLVNSNGLKSLYSGSWFVFGPVSEQMFRQGEGENFSNELSRPSTGNDEYLKVFVGLSVPFEAKIISSAMAIPFISSVSGDDDAAVFKTNINTMMIREISHKECLKHMGEDRRAALKGLVSGAAYYKVDKYFRMEDNGC